MTEVFAFGCRHKDRPHWQTTIYNARTRGEALREYFDDVRDCWPDVKWTDLRARKLGGPVPSAMFQHIARIRGMADLRPGDRITSGYGNGVIVDAGSGANFVVIFDSGEFTGKRLVVHPSEFHVVPRPPDPTGAAS